MPAVEVELQRRLPDSTLTPWLLNADGTDPVADAVARTTLASILTRLNQALVVGGTVTLDAPTLAALETINAAVTGTVAVSGGTITLDAASLAALETINAIVSGTVAVSNFPATQPISGIVTVANPTSNPETGLSKEATLVQLRDKVATDTALVPLLDGIEGLLTSLRTDVQARLTNTELRATPVNVATQAGLALDATLALIRAEQHRRTDSIASGTNFLGYTGSYEDGATSQGRYRFAGGKATTSVANPNASITLSNPAASGVDLILTRYSVEVDAAADIVLFTDATSTGAVSANLNPNQRTTVANPGVVRVGASVLTGGTQASVNRRANTQSPVSVGPFRFRIIPGGSMSIRYVAPGAINNVWFNMGWFVVDEGADLL